MPDIFQSKNLPSWFVHLVRLFYRFKKSLIKARAVALQYNDLLLFLGSLIAVIVVVYDFGFAHQRQTMLLIHKFFKGFLFAVRLLLILRLLLKITMRPRIQEVLAEGILLLVIWLLIAVNYTHSAYFDSHYPQLGFLGHTIITYVAILATFIVEFGKQSLFLNRLNFNPGQLFILSFVFLILVGTGLLLLPTATHTGISFTDALFTSTSAVCVTGLIVVDTATHFTGTGKTIIFMLFQAGGLGIMTFTSFFGLFYSGSSTFKDHFFLRDLTNSEKIGDIFKTLIKIFFITFGVEIAGAFAIYHSVGNLPLPGQQTSWEFAIFHAVSAFCNAGFSSLSAGLADPMVASNIHFQTVISILIILGGLGFPIVFNFYQYIKHHIQRFFSFVFKLNQKRHVPNIVQLSSRIVLITTLILLVLGVVTTFLLEQNNSYAGMSVAQKWSHAFFTSTTSRTAGFNTVDYNLYGNATIVMMLVLMWIGASPSSTGGGIKTTTLAVAFLHVWNLARGRTKTELFFRQISDSSIMRAYAIIFSSVIVILGAAFLIAAFDPQIAFRSIIFEAFSAFSTVGLSLGITSSLSLASKYVLIALMFVGRVGVLAMILALVPKAASRRYSYPNENLIIN